MKLQKSFAKALTLAVLTASFCQPMSATLGSKIEQVCRPVVKEAAKKGFPKFLYGLPVVGSVLGYFGYKQLDEKNETAAAIAPGFAPETNVIAPDTATTAADTVPTIDTTSDVATPFNSKFDALKATFSDKLDALKAKTSELMTVATEKTESVCGSVADLVAKLPMPSAACEFAVENPKTTTALVISTALVATYAAYKAYRLARAYVAAKYGKNSPKNK